LPIGVEDESIVKGALEIAEDPLDSFLVRGIKGLKVP